MTRSVAISPTAWVSLGSLALIVGLAAGDGLVLARSPHGLLLAAAIATATVLLGVGGIALQSDPRVRLQIGRQIMWIGLFASFAVGQARTAASVAGGAITTLNLVQGALPAVAAVGGLAIARPAFGRATRVEKALLVYLAVIVASTVWSVDGTATFLKAGQLAVAYLVLALLVRSGAPAVILAELTGWLYVFVSTTLIGLAVSPSRAYSASAFTGVRRLRGIFPSVGIDTLGLVAAAAVVLTLARLGPRWTLRRRGVIPVLVLVLLVVLYLSGSRTGAGAVCIGTATLLLSQRRTRPIALLLAALAVTFLVTGARSVVSSQAGGFLYHGQSTAELSTLNGRTQIWSAALGAWRSRPLLGYGYYSGHRLNAAVTTRVVSETTNLDNVWVETLVDLGVVGLLSLGAAMVAAGYFWWSTAGGSIVRGCRALFTAGLLASFFNPGIQILDYPMVIFGCVLFLAYRVPERLQLPRLQGVAPLRSAEDRTEVLL